MEKKELEKTLTKMDKQINQLTKAVSILERRLNIMERKGMRAAHESRSHRNAIEGIMRKIRGEDR